MHSVYSPLKWVCPNLENFKKNFKKHSVWKKTKGEGGDFWKQRGSLTSKVKFRDGKGQWRPGEIN